MNVAKTYVRRTPEQVVADLEAQIAAVKQRAEARQAAAEVKGSPDGVAFLAAVKATDRAIRVAGEQRNESLIRSLEAARAPMAERLVSMGIRMPDRKASKKRKARVAS